MRFGADGEAQKLALYHKDPAHQPDWIAAEVEARHPGAQILYWEREWYEGDGDVFEVEFKTAEGVECELSFLADKTLKYTETSLELNEEVYVFGDASRLGGGWVLSDGRMPLIVSDKGGAAIEKSIERKVTWFKVLTVLSAAAGVIGLFMLLA